MVEPLHSTMRTQGASYAKEAPKTAIQHGRFSQPSVDHAAPSDSLKLSTQGEMAGNVIEAALNSDGVDAERVDSIRAFVAQHEGGLDPDIIAAGLLNSGALSSG